MQLLADGTSTIPGFFLHQVRDARDRLCGRGVGTGGSIQEGSEGVGDVGYGEIATQDASGVAK